jgi:phage N-6-adenine-methyltransferase
VFAAGLLERFAPALFVEESFVPAPPESETDSWATPQEEFDKINRDFNFNLDVCASHENYKCKPYFTIKDNGLKQSWAGKRCWANIPFSNPAPWLKKAWEESQNNSATVVVLMKHDTSTQHWHKYCTKASDVRLFTRRIRFVKPPTLKISKKTPPPLTSRWTSCRVRRRRGLTSSGSVIRPLQQFRREMVGAVSKTDTFDSRLCWRKPGQGFPI